MIRIVLTGGGSGGHVYPLLAVAGEFEAMPDVDVQISYVGPSGPFDSAMKEKDISVYRIASSKLRRYASMGNIADIPKFFWSFFQALYRLFRIMPDVVFSKGGPGAFPVVCAARFYLIPVLVHESDAIPGLTNRLSSRIATRVAISFPEAITYFPKKKTALVGNPVRKELKEGIFRKEQAREYFSLNPTKPTIFIFGGSQGAVQINDFVFNNLKTLLEKDVQIIHQVGPANKKNADDIVNSLERECGDIIREKYRYFDILNGNQYRNALSASDIVISRSGSAIFEIALFGKASILIPLETSANDHQRANAYSYSKTGAAIVLEKDNFTPHIVLMKIEELLSNSSTRNVMEEAAKHFSKPNAARDIAEELITLALKR